MNHCIHICIVLILLMFAITHSEATTRDYDSIQRQSILTTLQNNDPTGSPTRPAPASTTVSDSSSIIHSPTIEEISDYSDRVLKVFTQARHSACSTGIPSYKPPFVIKINGKYGTTLGEALLNTFITKEAEGRKVYLTALNRIAGTIGKEVGISETGDVAAAFEKLKADTTKSKNLEEVFGRRIGQAPLQAVFESTAFNAYVADFLKKQATPATPQTQSLATNTRPSQSSSGKQPEQTTPATPAPTPAGSAAAPSPAPAPATSNAALTDSAAKK